MAPFPETTRDTHTFTRRVGDLPVQAPGEDLDFRGALHRDGTVYNAVSLADLKQPEVRRGWGWGWVEAGGGGRRWWWWRRRW